MYTPIQLEAIRLFGRKDLTEGCILRDKVVGTYCKYIAENLCIWEGENDADIQHRGFREERFEILGHIPHLEDLFRLAEERNIQVSTSNYDASSNTPNEIVIWKKDPIKNGGDGFDYDFPIPLLDQPSLPEIISLFK